MVSALPSLTHLLSLPIPFDVRLSGGNCQVYAVHGDKVKEAQRHKAEEGNKKL